MTNDKSTLTRRTVLQKGALTAGGLTLGGAAFSGVAAADQWDEVIDLTGLVVSNPCTGEDATATSGTARLDLDIREDDSGGFHLNFTFVAEAQLVGNDTGLRYQASFAQSGNLYVDADSKPLTFTISLNGTITSQGPADDLHERMLVHVTVNADDTLTVSIDTESVKCLG
jgi:hypothetical protein